MRTLAEGQPAYNPMEYHNGSVWPHDTSLIAAGLARYGRRAEAGTLATATMMAAVHFGYCLPATGSRPTRSSRRTSATWCCAASRGAGDAEARPV